MKPRTSHKWLYGILLAAALGAPLTHAENSSQAFIGKDDWLFSTVEFSDTINESATNASIDLIRRFNKILTRNGITMIFTMPPMKARIYSEHLPDDVKINPYMNGNYERMTQMLRTGQVNVIDLNTPFLNSPKRTSDTPLFFRLDTHWAPAGAMLAAETIHTAVDANPVLKKVLETVPDEKYAMAWSKHKVNSATRGLVDALPANSPAYAIEQILPFFVRKEKAGGNLLGDHNDATITLLGSSYSRPEYGFSDALRYTLQRDILAVWLPAPQGGWVAMESYLRDDAFQTKKPKLLIWEMAERSMDAPPDYKYREDRYQSDNTEWLLRVAAWVQGSCTPSPVAAKIVAGDLVTAETESVAAGKTTDKNFVELSFSKPLTRLDYLVASIATNGSKKMVLEASGAGEETRWFDVAVPGDGAEHVLKTPLPSYGKGYTKLRIYPGKNSAFTLKGLQVCRQPEDLLK